MRLEKVSEGRPLAVVRRRVGRQEVSRVVVEGCGTVWKVMRAQGIKGAGRHVAVYLDGEINLEVGVELKEPFAGVGEVVGSAIPAGVVATAVHFGPYDWLHLAHKAVREWCVKNGVALAGPNWEIYGHWEEAWNREPGMIRTDVFYLLGSASGRPG